MDDEIIEVVINPDGSVEVKVEGVKGPDCTVITEGLEQILGGEFERTYTGEYYEHCDITDKRKQNLS